MKDLCLIRTRLTDETLSRLVNTLEKKYTVIVKNGDSSSNPFTDDELENAAVIIGNPSLKTIEKRKNLKWLQLASSGADMYANSGLLNPEKTLLTNATGAYGHAISEYMVATVFMMIKKLHLYRDNQFSGKWTDLGFSNTIRGSKVLVVGLGDIGKHFAEKMNSLGARIYAIKRTITKEADYIHSVDTLDKLDDLLPEMDIVVLCLPNSARTAGVMSEKQFKLMKNSAIMVNVGRGNAVNTNDLVSALKENIIGGAILDVTNPEPLPRDHPLWKQPNAVITPHISGGYHAKETIEGIERIILHNAENMVEGKPLINIVDYNTGYRKTL